MTSTKITNEQFPVKLSSRDLRDFVHGADWSWSFQVLDDDNVTPLDTTGWTAELTLRESENGEVYLTLTNGAGITMTAASGLFVIDIPAATMDTLDFQKAVFKLIMTDDTAGITPYFLGQVRFAEV